MEYFDRASAYEFKLMEENTLGCWHITGSSIDISVSIMPDKSLHIVSDHGIISAESNEKLFHAITRAYKHWNLI